jgi:hypothetical protein
MSGFSLFGSSFLAALTGSICLIVSSTVGYAETRSAHVSSFSGNGMFGVDAREISGTGSGGFVRCDSSEIVIGSYCKQGGGSGSGGANPLVGGGSIPLSAASRSNGAYCAWQTNLTVQVIAICLSVRPSLTGDSSAVLDQAPTPVAPVSSDNGGVLGSGNGSGNSSSDPMGQVMQLIGLGLTIASFF